MIGVDKLSPCIAAEHVEDHDLAPLIHVHQQVAQFPVVLVDHVDSVRTHRLKRHDHTACHQLQEHRGGEGRGGEKKERGGEERGGEGERVRVGIKQKLVGI